MARMIYRCSNQICRHVYAYDYPEKQRSHIGFGRYSTRYFRNRPEGGRREIGWDSDCPKCGQLGARGQQVRGRKTEHICDARCTGARGPNCECSCAGRNHGRSFLCEAA